MERICKIDTYSLIGLCFIVDEYNEFCTDLRELVERNTSMRYIVEVLKRYLVNTRVFGEKRIKSFYQKYSNQLFNINNHIPLADFMFKNFDDLGNPQMNSKIFNEYLKENREVVYRILDLLFTFDKLGIQDIELDTSEKFINHTYEVNRDYFRNKIIYYLDNMKPVPSYSEDSIIYKTDSSNYGISVKPVFDKNNAIATKIKVNSLIFDNKRLPSKITKEIVFDDLVETANKYEPVSKAIRESVDFNLDLMDLEKAVHNVSSTTNKIERINKRQELITALQMIRSGLDTLQQLSSDYDNILIASSPEIDSELLQNEKMEQLVKRNNKK